MDNRWLMSNYASNPFMTQSKTCLTYPFVTPLIYARKQTGRAVTISVFWLRHCLGVHKGMEMNGMYLNKEKEWKRMKMNGM